MRRVISIGLDDKLHPDTPGLHYSHHHLAALDDADIVIFAMPPTPTPYFGGQWKPSLDDDQSFAFRDLLNRWRSELQTALAAGKTVVVQLTPPRVVSAATGRTERSGTGRNAQTIRYVDDLSTASCLPYQLKDPVRGTGSEIRVHNRAQVIADYWRVFGAESWYEVRFTATKGLKPLLTTKDENRLVGALLETNTGGHLLFLPPTNLGRPDSREDDDESLYDEDEPEADDTRQDEISEADSAWRERSFAFVHCLIAIDASLRSDEDASPQPEWVAAPAFATAAITRAEQALLLLQQEEASLLTRRAKATDDLSTARVLQGLLWAQGKPLERSVRCALSLMGVESDAFDDGESEFDAVFVIEGQRMLGEVEGRDNAAIDISKISQLERNIGEDFTRPEVSEHAKGVLFGNPQRNTPPADRTLDFTDKCRSSAKRNGFALVRTADMFGPAAYLDATIDAAYARECRKAIAEMAGGVVVFPQPPALDEPAPTIDADSQV